MVAVRCDDEVLLSAAATVTVPSPVPEDGEIVIHDGALLLTSQLMLEVMVNVFCSVEDEKLNEMGDTVK